MGRRSAGLYAPEIARSGVSFFLSGSNDANPGRALAAPTPLNWLAAE